MCGGCSRGASTSCGRSWRAAGDCGRPPRRRERRSSRAWERVRGCARPGEGAGSGSGGASVVDRLAEILTDAPARHRSSARHVTVGTPYGEEYRRLAADMLAEVELSDLEARTDDELGAGMGRLVRYEQQVSRRRQHLQRTADDCSAEIARRYRDGEAQVDDLLM